MEVEPNCGFEPKIASSALQSVDLVEGVLENDLVSYKSDSNYLRVKRTTNLDLFEQVVSLKLAIESPPYSAVIDTLVMINYESAGPMFDFYLQDGEVDPLKCSEEDKTWSFDLPEVVGSDQQTISMTF